MVLPKEKLAEHLTNIINENYLSGDRKKTQAIYKFVMDKHNMPLDIAKGIMTLAKPLEEYSDFELFCITNAIAESSEENFGDLLNKYYTENEIKRYSQDKYHEEVENPYVINNVIKIRDSQYFAKITASELRILDNASMINYNENTQRVMKRVRNGNEQFFKISINKKAVKEIKKLMSMNAYFPDPITLNIPQDDPECYTEFDESEGKLSIYNINHFDILDGYHRFVAMRELIEENPDFDYVMELRISEWVENQAQQFIFQQDQKTKMKATDSKSFNQFSLANRIVERLNTGMYSISGKIGRNEKALIMFNDMSDVIEKVFTHGVDPSDKDGRQILANVPKIIGSYFDILLDDDAYATRKFKYKELFAIIYIIRCGISRDVFVEKVNAVLNQLNDIRIIASVKPNKKTLEELERIIRS